MDPEEEARLAAEAQAKAEAEKAAEAAKAKEAAEAAKGKETEDRSKMSDSEAKLLKELMDQKAKAKATADALKAAEEKLSAYSDLDPEEAKAIKAQKAEAERKAAEARGEYDRIIEQIRVETQAREAAAKEAQEKLAQDLAAKQALIDDLTVGSAFRGSRFISENTVLSGEKARKLYGDHVDIKDGELVVYDKPRGAANRTPIVDQNGAHLSFEAAIEKVIKSDADFESIALSKLKAGTGSAANPTEKVKDSKKPEVSGRDRIAAVLSKRK